MSEHEFCKVLEGVQRDEKRAFVEAVNRGDMDRASRLLESIAFMKEASEGVCKIKKK